MEAHLWSLVLNICESWITGENERKNFVALEMWCCRKIPKIKWIDK